MRRPNPGTKSTAESLLIYTGVLERHDSGMAEWVYLLTYGSFSVLTVALVAAALGGASPGPRRAH